MSTKLGDVSIKIKLDTSDARTELTRLESKSEAETVIQPDSNEAPRVRPSRATKYPWERELERQPKISTPRQVEKIRDSIFKIEAREEMMGRLRRRAAESVGGREADTTSGVPSNYSAVDRIKRRFGLGGMDTVTARSTAALAGGIAVGAYETGKALPYAYSVARGFAAAPSTPDGRINVLEGVLEELRNTVTGIWAEVKAFTTGYAKTVQMESAAARITGQIHAVPVPGVKSSSVYYNLFSESDEANTRLEMKFEEFKGKALAEGFGKYMTDSFKRAFGK